MLCADGISKLAVVSGCAEVVLYLNPILQDICQRLACARCCEVPCQSAAEWTVGPLPHRYVLPATMHGKASLGHQNPAASGRCGTCMIVLPSCALMQGSSARELCKLAELC
jgi:hypothetical protein